MNTINLSGVRPLSGQHATDNPAASPPYPIATTGGQGVMQPRTPESAFGVSPGNALAGDKLIEGIIGQFKGWLNGDKAGERGTQNPAGESTFENKLKTGLQNMFKEWLGGPQNPGNTDATLKPPACPDEKKTTADDSTSGGLLEQLTGQFREWLGMPADQGTSHKPASLFDSLQGIFAEFLGKKRGGPVPATPWSEGEAWGGMKGTAPGLGGGMQGTGRGGGGVSGGNGGGSQGGAGRAGPSQGGGGGGSRGRGIGASPGEKQLAGSRHEGRVMQMLDKSIAELETAINSIDRNLPGTQAVLDKHFGSGDHGKQATRAEIRNDFSNALQVLKQHRAEGGKNITIYNKNDRTNAHVYPNDPTRTIHLQERFIGSNDNEVARVLIHEATHFGGAGDHWYGNRQKRGTETHNHDHHAKDNADTLSFAADELGRRRAIA